MFWTTYFFISTGHLELLYRAKKKCCFLHKSLSYTFLQPLQSIVKDISPYWQKIFQYSLVDNTQNEYYLHFRNEKIKAERD